MFSLDQPKDELIDFLKNKIYKVHLMPLPLHPLYKKYNSKIPIAKKVWKEIVSLPLHPNLKFSEIDFINKKLKEFSLNHR